MNFVKHFFKIMAGMIVLAGTTVVIGFLVCLPGNPELPMWFRVTDGCLMFVLVVALLTYKGD